MKPAAPSPACPVCGFSPLAEAPRSPSGGASYEICPCCGFQFGYDDDARGETYLSHRQRWIAGGMKWWSRGQKAPANWHPEAQLESLRRIEAPQKSSQIPGGRAAGSGYSAAGMGRQTSDVRDTVSTVRAAGGLVWRRGARGLELALIRRARHGDNEWSLPKGKLDPGETFEEAAVREVEEETGIRARLLRFAGVMQYEVKGDNKVVCLWDMEAIGEGRAYDNGEVKEVRWVTREEALKLLTHEQNRELLRHLPPPPL